MGRPKGSGTSGSLESGECKVVYVQGEELVAGLRFNSLGKYISFYATKDGLEALVKEAQGALKILKK